MLQPCLLASAKISILILLHRIFITPAFRIAAIVLMFIITAWFIALTLASALICSPIETAWNPNVQGKCGNQYIMDIIAPIPWILTDFIILLAPLPIVLKLQMPRRQKAGLVGLLLDLHRDTVSLAIWQVVESNSTILCVSLVASKPAMLVMLPDGLISKMGSSMQRQLLSRKVNKSAGMRSLRSPAGSNAGSSSLTEDPIELRRTSDSLSKVSYEVPQYQMGLTSDVELPAKVFQFGV
ncbi:MAG: hypothetical protein Q9213_002762 [Squamulea squamosa]